MKGFWEVDYICGKKWIEEKKQAKYLVKWKDYSFKDCTWESIFNLKTVPNLIRQYEKYQSRKTFEFLVNRNIIIIPSIKNNQETRKEGKISVSKEKKNSIHKINTTSMSNINYSYVEKLDINKDEILNATKKNLMDFCENSSINNSKFRKFEDNKLTKNNRNKFEGGSKNLKKKDKQLKEKVFTFFEGVKIFGIFGKDEPLKIIDHNSIKMDERIKEIGKNYYKIEWKKRFDGFKPKSSYFSIEEVKNNCPLLLIDYLKMNAILKDSH